jgi:hypothetical protein
VKIQKVFGISAEPGHGFIIAQDYTAHRLLKRMNKKINDRRVSGIVLFHKPFCWIAVIIYSTESKDSK